LGKVSNADLNVRVGEDIVVIELQEKITIINKQIRKCPEDK